MTDSKADKINAVLRKTVEGVLLGLQLDSKSTQSLRAALSHLCDIGSVYPRVSEQLYRLTVQRVGEVGLFEFQGQQLMRELINKYFSRLQLFKQAYEVSVLRLRSQKYGHLLVQQPEIVMVVPVPYQCAPLVQARFLGQAGCVTFEEEDEVERFS